MDPSHRQQVRDVRGYVRDAIASLTAVNVAIVADNGFPHAVAHLDAVEANVSEIRRIVAEKFAEADEAHS
jgi:hypothetical protein